MFSKYASAVLAAILVLGAGGATSLAASNADQSVSSPAPSGQRRAAPARSTQKGFLPWLLTLFGRGAPKASANASPAPVDEGPAQLSSSRVQVGECGDGG